MATNPQPGETYTFSIGLEDQANPGLFKAAPTIAAGDFQRSINGAAFANLDNLPTVTPAAGRLVQIVLSASETTTAGDGGRIDIVGHDASGDEWYDVFVGVRVGTPDVKLYKTQPAVTFGQVKILADAASEGALHIANSNNSGWGLAAVTEETGGYGFVAIGGDENVVPQWASKEDLYKYVALVTRNDAELATALSAYLAEININYGSGVGTYDNTTDSLQAIRNDLPQITRDAMKLAPTAGAPAAGSVDAHLNDLLEDTSTTLPALISAGGSGTGLYSETITVNDGDGLPVDGVLVQVATDSAFSNIVRSGYTNNLGQATLNFDATGTYYGRAEISDFDVATFTVTIS